MRFVRYRREGAVALGVHNPERGTVVDLDSGLGLATGGELGRLLELWSPDVREVLSGAAQQAGEPLVESQLLSPCAPLGRNVFCVGKNYRDHAAEFERSGFDATTAAAPGAAPSTPRPVIFTKATTAVIGPGEAILAHSALTHALDYEAELAVVVGTGGRAIRPERAWDHVFGYTILNDVTARDLQYGHQQWFLGKSLDTFCPIGPSVVTADELDPEHLAVRCWVNGELRQSDTTASLVFDIPTVIATISAGLTLLPGDVIATGTPSGVGAGFEPPRFLSPGDVVTIEISGIGRLSNPVVASE